MKTPIALAALLLVAAGGAAQAHEEIFTTTLSGPNESPPNTSPGLGTATVTFDLDLATMRVEVTFAGLLGNTTASHIHCCTAAPNAGTAGVATQVPTFIGFPLGVKAGSYDHTFDMTLASSYNPGFITAHNNSVGDSFAALVTGIEQGRAYLNIHTSAFGGGEIRGFLAAAPVPEPATYGMMMLGLAGLGGVLRSRHRS